MELQLNSANLQKLEEFYFNVKSQKTTNSTETIPICSKYFKNANALSSSHSTNDDVSQSSVPDIYIPIPIRKEPKQRATTENPDYFYNMLVTASLNYMFSQFLKTKEGQINVQRLNAEEILRKKQIRQEKIKRYLEKKRNRKWDVLRYEVRKKIAKTRQRVKGRFVREDKKQEEQNIILNQQQQEQLVIANAATTLSTIFQGCFQSTNSLIN